MSESLKALLERCRLRNEEALAERLPSTATTPARLHEALRYAALDGGKRVRPVLVYATGAIFGVDEALLDAPACAVEFIHAYSLVHDDLPAMDDDELRRGKPTCHIAYDEATAILVGDALQALAFETLAADAALAPLSAERRLAMVAELARASGSVGMVGGQAIDIEATGERLDLAQLQAMHRAKTGALIRAAVRLGALAAADADENSLARLDDYAAAIGLAFQIQDDILDVTADTATLGKPQGSDAAADKATYTALLGLEGAREMAQQQHQLALAALEGFGPAAEPLRQLSAYIVSRGH